MISSCRQSIREPIFGTRCDPQNGHRATQHPELLHPAEIRGAVELLDSYSFRQRNESPLDSTAYR